MMWIMILVCLLPNGNYCGTTTMRGFASEDNCEEFVTQMRERTSSLGAVYVCVGLEELYPKGMS